MASDRWTFDTVVHRYRDETTGRFIARNTIIKMRDDLVEAQRASMSDLARRVSDREITIQQFEIRARQVVKETQAAEYIFGRGGRNAMTQADYGRVGQMVRGQYEYLHGFSQAIANGDLTAAQIEARAQLYVSAGVHGYELGRAASFGLQLPAYPADGSSECKSNDRCRWDIDETDTEFRATWRLGGSEPCDTCSRRAGEWSPYVVEKVIA